MSSPTASRRQKVLLAAIGCAVVVLIVVPCVLRIFVVQPFYIPSGAMRPTLVQGDSILVNKLAYSSREPRVGDIVVFAAPKQASEENKAFIKRVVAAPGDTIQVRRGEGMYCNGQPFAEPYIAEAPDFDWPIDDVYVLRPGGQPQKIDPTKGIGPPPGYLLVMGDNRNDSNDSHKWETRGADGMYYGAPFLPRENVLGKAMCIFWPPDRVRVLH